MRSALSLILPTIFIRSLLLSGNSKLSNFSYLLLPVTLISSFFFLNFTLYTDFSILSQSSCLIYTFLLLHGIMQMLCILILKFLCLTIILQWQILLKSFQQLRNIIHKTSFSGLIVGLCPIKLLKTRILSLHLTLMVFPLKKLYKTFLSLLPILFLCLMLPYLCQL